MQPVIKANFAHDHAHAHARANALENISNIQPCRTFPLLDTLNLAPDPASVEFWGEALEKKFKHPAFPTFLPSDTTL